MKIILILGFIFGCAFCVEDFNGIDYLPATQAFTKIKIVQSEYQTFRQKIAKNVSIDYNRCVQIIKEKKCNNIDQWQSVIEELKLETQNSIDVEVPFLKTRKAHKVDRLKQLMEVTDKYDQEMLEIVGKLSAEQAALYSEEFEVNNMYKLPMPEIVDTPVLAQQDINVPVELNSDIPKVAKQELTGAKSQYEAADLSIQAEAARDELHSAGDKLKEVIENLQVAFEFKQAEILDEKRQLKDDIIRLRALIATEEELQSRNTAKIGEIEGRIASCAGQPMNVEKDCEPIKIRAAKMNTEIDIIMARTMKLYKQIGQLMDENETDEEVAAKKAEIEAERKAAEEKAKEMEYIVEEDLESKVGPPVDPKERKPAHHLKENLVE